MLALDETLGEKAALPAIRVKALYWASRLAMHLGKIDRARALAGEALTLARRSEDQADTSAVLALLGAIALAGGEEDNAATLAQYQVEREPDHKQIQNVSSPRLVETPFRSPQLTLWTLGPDEWLLYWRTPDYAPRTRRRHVDGLVQPVLFDVPR